MIHRKRKTAKKIRAVRSVNRRPPARKTPNGAHTRRLPLRVEAADVSVRNLFEHAWDAVAVTDRNRRIVDANRSTCRMFGVPRERLLSLRIDDFGRGLKNATYRRLLDGVLRPPLLRGEYVLKLDAPAARTLDIIGARIDKNHAVFVFRDITERKQAEEKTKASEEKFRSIIRDAGLGIAFVDLNGVHVDVNNAFCEMTGYCREELVGRGMPYPYWPKDQTERFLRGMRNALQGRVSVAETAFIRKNGQRLPVRVHPSFVKDHTGATVGAIGIFEDISAWETLQQELVYSQKMQTVGALAGGIVHEFNNVHCGMRLVIENALAEMRHPLPIRQDLETVLERLERASSITGQLSAFVQRTPSHKTSTAIEGIVEEALGMAATTLRKAEISVELDMGRNVPDLVLDRVQMVQALLNLMLNARDAMESAAVRRLTVQTGVDDGRAFIQLRDTGSGIAAEYIGSIFDPFFTTRENRGEQVRSGFGLGLTVSETIIRDHGGSIDVTSTVGEGSAFTVWLPLGVSTGVSRASLPAELQDKIKGRKILIAENDSKLRTLLGDALRSVGCSVDAAGSVERSLNLMAGRRHDVIVMSAELQAGGTEKLLRAVARKAPANRPATIVVAERFSGAARGTMTAEGARAILLKPVTLDSLYAALNAAIVANEKKRAGIPARRRAARRGR